MSEEPNKPADDAAVTPESSDDTATGSVGEGTAEGTRVSSEDAGDTSAADDSTAAGEAEEAEAEAPADEPVADPVAEEELPVAAEASESEPVTSLDDPEEDDEDDEDSDDEDSDEDEEDDEDSDDDVGAEAAKPARSRLRRRRGADDDAPAPAPTRRRSQRDPNAPAPVVRAQAKYVRSSARKARLVCDQFRGKSVEEARAILAVTPRAIARDWSKLLESAVANAEHNHELVGEDLYVKAAHADEGPTIKRFRPRAKGRATRIRKRTSHLTILLTPKD
jgi:ribosomal protein L22